MDTSTVGITKSHVQAHLHGILSNWAGRWSEENGGFDCYVRPDGELYRQSNRRPLVIQSRLLYMYGEALLHGQEQYKDIAARSFNYLKSDMLDEELGWYNSLGRHPRFGNEERASALNTYDNLFVVIAMAKYYKACANPAVAEEALRLFELINNLCEGHNLSQDGIQSYYSKEVSERMRWWGKYSGNTLLHYLEAVVNLEEAGIGDGHKKRISELRSLFLNHLYNEEHQVVHDHYGESFADPRMHAGARTSQGHALEWIDFFRVIDEFALPEEVERGICDAVAERAIDKETHLFVNMYFYHERMSAGVVDFWGQPEAIKTFNAAASIYGYPYADIGRQLLESYFHYMVDEDNGIFYELDRNGVVTDRRKGGSWKCDYHSTRMCVDLLDRKNGILVEGDV